MTSVLMPLADGFEEIEALATVDILRRGGVTVRTVSLTDLRAVVGSHGITVMADGFLHSIGDVSFDAIALPGGPGHQVLAAHDGLRRLLRQHQKDGRVLAAVCAAPVVLARAGMLRGMRITCFPSVEEECAAAGAIILHEPAVTDRWLVTGRGAGTAVHFALELLQKLEGREVRDRVAATILHPEVPTAS